MRHTGDDQSGAGHPLRPGASPQAIRAGLIEDDRERFDSEYRAALIGAGPGSDFASRLTTLEQWRRIAVMQSDPVAYRDVVRHAAHLITGEESAADEPLAVSRAKAGM